MAAVGRMDGGVRVAEDADGTLLYHVGGTPALLPPVLRRDLLEAWDAARDYAREGRWGVGRSIRFAEADGVTDIALVDRDARCWADAADARAGLHTRYGLSLCLRLLALIDIVGRVPQAGRLMRVEAGEAVLHPELVAAAATSSLDEAGGFDAATLLAGVGGAWQALRHQNG